MKNIFKFIVTLAVIVAFSFGATAQAFTIGQTGSEVSQLQAHLIESGYNIPAITSGTASFGYFGPQTQAALEAYQASTKPVKLGAISGPDVYSPYMNFNGVRYEYRSMSLRGATTTPCAFISPSSTSTLLVSTLQVTTGTTTALVWTIAKSVTSFTATTTLIATIPTASGANVSTSTSPLLNSSATIFEPNSYLVVGMAGLSANSLAGAALVGSCKAEFLVL